MSQTAWICYNRGNQNAARDALTSGGPLAVEELKHMTDVIQLELPFQETAVRGCVYKIVFPDGSTYVGSTTRLLRERISYHISAIRSDTAKSAIGLSIAAKQWGFERVRCEDTGRRRWQFKGAVITGETVFVGSVDELRKLEHKAISCIDPDKLLNSYAAYTGLCYVDNDFTIPVSCQAWVDMLYPEQSEHRIDAAA